MTKVILGNHSSVLVPRTDRENINQFYVEVLGGKLMQADPDRDFIRLGDNFFIAFLYSEVEDAGDLHRSARAIWLELKSDDVAETRRKILDSGLVRRLEIPDPHLYFQAPGGQCLRLVGVDEDLSFYEGTGTGPDMAKIKAALQKNSLPYTTAKYTTTVEVPGSLKEVFDHVIQLSKWWPEDFEGETIQLGTEFIFKTGDGHYSKNKVIEFVPNKKVAWLTTGSLRKTDNFDWTGTKMIVEISPEGNHTLLKFTYDGVVLQNESHRLAQICDMTVKELFYNFIVNGKGKNEQ